MVTTDPLAEVSPPQAGQVTTSQHRIGQPAYVGAIAVVECLLAFLTGYAMFALGSGFPLAVLAAALSVPVSGRMSQQLVNTALRAVLRAAPPLTQLEPEAAALAMARTCFVYPLIVRSLDDIDDLVATVRITADGAGTGFAGHLALVDFPDRDVAVDPSDDALREAVEDRLRAERKRLGSGIFVGALFRFRRWNASEGVWMGWERKRGKLIEFAQLVAGATNTSFVTAIPAADEMLTLVRGLRYAITLDMRSELYPGGASELVRTIAHPANRPAFDPVSGRLLSGATFVRPTVVSRKPETLFAWMTRSKRRSSQPSMQQQHLGQDCFLGQGAIDLAAFLSILENAIPENMVLSHDKLEGMHGGAVCETRALIVDDAPEDHVVARQRDHRWTRGDVQLIPWIIARPRASVRRLPLLARYMLFDDLLYLLAPATTLALASLGWLVLPGPAAGLFGVAVVFVPLVINHFLFLPILRIADSLRRRWATPALYPPLVNPHLSDFYGQVTRKTLAELMGLPMWMVIMVDRAVRNTDATLRTLFRMFISRRHLLQWTPSRASGRTIGPGLWYRYRAMWASCLLTAGIGTAVWAANRPAFWYAAPLLAVWLAAPLIVYLTGRPAKRLPLTAPADVVRRPPSTIHK